MYPLYPLQFHHMNIFAVTTLLTSWVCNASAAPALVWKDSGVQLSSPIYSSELTDLPSLIVSTIPSFSDNKDGSSLSTVVFMMDRYADGTEILTHLLSEGDLPNIATRYEKAHSVHTHVGDVMGHHTIAKDVQRVVRSPDRVKTVSMSAFNKKKTTFKKNVIMPIVIVTVPIETAPNEIDTTVSSVIDDYHVHSVLVTSVPFLNERQIEGNRLKNRHVLSGRRRLEDQNDNGDDKNNDDYYDTTGIYFVNMTPTILAGILFMFFFIAVTQIGIGSMNMISGQDVFAKKYNTIGREA